MDYDSMKRELEIAIHQFAKRQATWFRGMERRGIRMHKISYDIDHNDFVALVKQLINEHR